MELTVTGMKIGLKLHQITHLVSSTVGNYKLTVDENSTSIFSFKVIEMLIWVSIIYFQNIQLWNIVQDQCRWRN